MDRGKWKITGPIMILVGLFFGWTGYQKGNVSARMKKEGVTVPGSVVNRETTFGRRRSRTYKLVAEFAVKDGGQVLSQTFQVPKSAYDANPDGASVSVRYLASDPNVAEIEGMSSNGVAEIFGGLVVGVVGVGLFLFAFR